MCLNFPRVCKWLDSMPNNTSAPFLWIPNCVCYQVFFAFVVKANLFRTFSKWCKKSRGKTSSLHGSSSSSSQTRFRFSQFLLLVSPLLFSVHIWNSLWCPFSLSPTKYVLSCVPLFAYPLEQLSELLFRFVFLFFFLLYLFKYLSL